MLNVPLAGGTISPRTGLRTVAAKPIHTIQDTALSDRTFQHLSDHSPTTILSHNNPYPKMDNETAKAEIAKISQEADPTIRMLNLASFVSQLFRDKGYELIVVGGSAIELYTEGEYASGDLDLTWKDKRPPLAEIQQLMRDIGADGGPRNFEIAGMFVDLLGQVESSARTPFQTIKGPYGEVTIVQAEMLLAERILVASGTTSWTAPTPNEAALNCARVLLLACMNKNIEIDWNEATRLAESPEYGVGRRLEELKSEVANSVVRQRRENISKKPKDRE